MERTTQAMEVKSTTPIFRSALASWSLALGLAAVGGALGLANELGSSRRAGGPQPAAAPPAAERASATIDLVASRAGVHIEKGAALANRGAVFAARDEFILALEMIGNARDSQERTNRYHVAIIAGLTALNEADDFVSSQPLGSKAGMKGIIAAHRTPALKEAAVEGLTPPIAIQRYCDYAQQQLLVGCDNIPIAARALFGLARTEEAMARDSANETVGCPKAMVLFETAMRIDPRNHQAANELGVLLARYGQLDAAVAVLKHSVQIKPTAEGYYNLSVVYGRMGLAREAELALAQSRKFGPVQSGSSAQPGVADVKVVDLATFQDRSPAEADLGLNPARQATPSVIGAAGPSQAPTPTTSNNASMNPTVRAKPAARPLFREGGPIGSLLGKKNSNTIMNR
jgi:tetratricopeptide (TPR) repeat protein